MTRLASIRAKANAHYTCQECGLTELIQAHHEIPNDEDSLIVLCAECHSERHPNVPKALFFSKSKQPYWHNKSASSLAKAFGVHPRTIVRTARKLGILSGELSPWDEELIKKNIGTRHYTMPRRNPRPKEKTIANRYTYAYFCGKCGTHWISLKEDSCCPCGHAVNKIDLLHN